MKLITRFELASRSLSDLHSLYGDTFNALVRSVPDSPERRNVLASLENIAAEIAMRHLRP